MVQLHTPAQINLIFNLSSKFFAGYNMMEYFKDRIYLTQFCFKQNIQYYYRYNDNEWSNHSSDSITQVTGLLE